MKVKFHKKYKKIKEPSFRNTLLITTRESTTFGRRPETLRNDLRIKYTLFKAKTRIHEDELGKRKKTIVSILKQPKY